MSKPKEKIEWMDRYGGNYLDPETVCNGQCEGTGFVPVHKDVLGEPSEDGKATPVYEEVEPWRTLWLEAEAKEPADDGWHFVACPDCNGTGKVGSGPADRRPEEEIPGE